MALQQFNIQHGVTNVKYDVIPGGLVDKARNDAVRQMLALKEAQWICFVDADMTFQPDALLRLLQAAYHTTPFYDAVGAYCQLRGGAALPTIDTGTGTWESWFPGSGIVEVIRTGGAGILIKRHVFERMPQPWFALRVPMRPIDALLEVDNFARIKFDGRNPFRGPQWDVLEQCAMDDPSIQQFTPGEVGEDSAFCDKMRAHGFRIGVDTGTAFGHLDEHEITAMDHKKAVDDQDRQRSLAVGLIP